jgi:hypothetical protein
LRKDDQKDSSEKLRLELGLFLTRRACRESRCLDGRKNTATRYKSNTLDLIDDGTETYTEAQKLTFTEIGALSETFEGHRVILA